MSTPHNRRPKRAISPSTVLMPGDPLRAKFIAETFLESPRRSSPTVRGMLRLHRHLPGPARLR